MLIRRDQQERQDGSQYRHKLERTASSQGDSRSHSAPAPAPQSQSHTEEHSQSKPSSSPSEDGGKTPRTQTARKPRQAKPSA
jgi:hypothetical protein